MAILTFYYLSINDAIYSPAKYDNIVQVNFQIEKWYIINDCAI